MSGPMLAAAPALRALSVGEILDASFTMYRKHFGALATIVLVCSLVPVVLGMYLMALGGLFTNIPLWLFYLLLSVVLGAIATGATVFVVSESYLGRTITASDAFRRAAPRFGAIAVCSLTLGIVVMLGFLLLVVPGFILGCGLVLAIPAVVLEPQLVPSDALSRSWALTRGNRGRMFALLATAFILIYVPAIAVEGLITLFGPSGGLRSGTSVGIAQVASSLVQMFLSPLLYCVLTVAYYDLRVRKEGFDLELLASSLRPA